MKRPVRSFAVAALAVAVVAAAGCSSRTQSASRTSGSSAYAPRASLGAGDALGSTLFGSRKGTSARVATARAAD
ncbi:MAG: hypothetical protein KJZ54_13110 [Phycisphaerales bacterium]|nr:hypothetical protein [Phycisphaerales bacterium]